MIQIILKFTFLSQIFPDQQHGNLVIHQLFSTQYLFQLNNSATQQLSNSVTQQLSNSATLSPLKTLHTIQFGINTIQTQEFFMSSPFDDFSFMEDTNQVGIFDGRQAVGDHDRGTVFHQIIQSLLY